MNRLLASVFLLLGTAQAAQANCKTLLLTGTSLSYTTEGVFPNAPEDKDFRFLKEGSTVGPQTVCGLTFTPDRKAGTVTITGKTFALFGQLFSKYVPANAKGRLDITNQFVFGGSPEEQTLQFNPSKRTLAYKAKPNWASKTTAAVKIDGGPLKPLFFNDKGTPVSYPASARVVDMYVRAESGGYHFWNRVRIDLKRPSITVYDEATMPSK